MRVLVTGSEGLLGGAVVDLLRPHHDVVGLDRVAGDRTTVVGSVADRAAVGRAARGIDAIVHTASLHAPHVGLVDERRFAAVNVEGTANLLEAAAAAGAGRFVYTSTTSVYGDALLPRDRAVWVTEDLPSRPRDVYDRTKLAAEGLCARFARERGLPSICLRVARFFPEPPATVAVHRLCRGVDVRDAAGAHRLALEAPARLSGTFNISARSPFRQEDLPDLLADAPAVIRRCFPWAEQAFAARGWRLPPTLDRVYVVARAEADLGYRPVHDFASLFAEAERRA